MNYEDRVTKEYLENALGSCARIVTGTYTGDGEESQFIDLGATPKAVYVFNELGISFLTLSNGREYYGGMTLQGYPLQVHGMDILSIETGGFRAYWNYNVISSYSHSILCNSKNALRFYIAFF